MPIVPLQIIIGVRTAGKLVPVVGEAQPATEVSDTIAGLASDAKAPVQSTETRSKAKT